MKAVILAGGRGTRISEESHIKPKPMVTIGEKPILWHILKTYSAHGINEFIICLGYRGYVIKEYFANYALHAAGAVTFDLHKGGMEFSGEVPEPWKITLVETGLETQTGGRIKRILDWVKDDEAFCMTYGDGLANVDISKSIEFHRNHGGLATVTTVAPAGRFGVIDLAGDQVVGFHEKPTQEGTLINGGYFVLSPKAGDYIDGDQTIWEREPLIGLARDKQLSAFHHSGFWQPMDTMREREILEQEWASGKAPWCVW